MSRIHKSIVVMIIVAMLFSMWTNVLAAETEMQSETEREELILDFDEETFLNVTVGGAENEGDILNKVDNIQSDEIFSSSSNSNSSNSSSSSGNPKWYYNIGTSLPKEKIPDYSKYSLLGVVKKGDIIYEANGGSGITGHIAIVEGIFIDPETEIKYIRLIEAIDQGVVRSCLDDERVDDKDVTVLRVKEASSIVSDVVKFCIDELGSDYVLDAQKDTSPEETDWYCSELVWAAYLSQGVDIETSDSLNWPGIAPKDILNSDKVMTMLYDYSSSYK